MRRPSDWIDPFEPASDPPPRTLIAFIRWALAGAWKVLLAGSVLAIALGVIEVAAAMVLGRVVEVVDPNGNKTAYEYNEAGHPVGLADPGGNQWRMTRDARGLHQAVHLDLHRRRGAPCRKACSPSFPSCWPEAALPFLFCTL